MWTASLLKIFSLTLGISCASTFAQPFAANQSRSAPQVDLNYVTYRGTSLPNGINQFLGMRYAAPPTGSRRFRKADAPLNETGIVNAQQHGPVCLSVNNPATPNPPLSFDEDCLYIDVYAPANATNLPVMLWIQGGGYVQNYNANYNGTGLIEASGSDVIVVTFNYRVGPYGFLANSELEAEKNLNIGLYDQVAAMRWVQEHIHAFGGDANRVTLFGVSVGGGSVLLHLLAYGGANQTNSPQSMWAAGIAESMFLPAVWTVDEMDFQYKHLLKATNCSDLECLRSLPVARLQAANVAIPYPGQVGTALFGYGPVIDGAFLPERPLNLLESGKFARNKSIILGSSNTEGTIFTPQVNNTAQLDQFITSQLPGLTNATLAQLNSLYSDVPSTYPGVTTPEAPLYYRAAEIYGDSSFICPAFTFAAYLSNSSVPAYLYVDHIQDPVEVAAGYLVPHTWDLQAVWGPKYATNYAALSNATSYDAGKVNAPIVPVVQAYWTSFAKTVGNPNAFKEQTAPAWSRSTKGGYLNIQTNATKMEQVSMEMARRCVFWATHGNETHH